MRRPAREAYLKTTMEAPQEVSIAAVALVISELESLVQLKKSKERHCLTRGKGCFHSSLDWLWHWQLATMVGALLLLI